MKKIKKEVLEKLELLFRLSENGIIWHDQGEILAANEKFCQIFQCEKDEIINKSFIEFIHPSCRQKAVSRAVSNNSNPINLTAERNGDDFPVILVSKFTKIDNNNINLLFFADLSLHHEDKKNFEQSNIKAQIAEQNIQSFISQIKLNVKPLLKEINAIAHSDSVDSLAKIRKNSQNIYNTINDLIELTEVDEKRLEVHRINTNIYPIVQEVTDSFLQSSQNNRLIFESESSDIYALTDKRKTKQILIKLLTFALDSANDKPITLSLVNNNNFAEIFVHFHHRFATPKEINIIKGKEANMKNNYSNKELNLLLLKKLVDINHSQITVKMLTNAEIKLEIKIPKYRQTMNSEEQAIKPKNRVFIVDDENILAEILKKFLELEDYEVQASSDPKSAFENILKFKPDLIISDIMMPVVDGYQILRQIRNHPDTKNLPVILISGYADEAKGLELGANAFLKRPVKKNRLFELVHKYIEE